MTDPIFSTELDFRWGDMDALGHVNNTVYFCYFEETRIRFLKKYDLIPDNRCIDGPVVVHVEAEFKKPVIYPATIRVDMFCDQPGRSSFKTHYKLYSNDTLATIGAATVVWVDYQKNKAIRLPDKVRDLLTQHGNQ